MLCVFVIYMSLFQIGHVIVDVCAYEDNCIAGGSLDDLNKNIVRVRPKSRRYVLPLYGGSEVLNINHNSDDIHQSL